MGMNCSLSLPASELEAINEGTKHITDNRMRFLEMVEENGRNKVIVSAGRAWVKDIFVESYYRD